MCSKKFEDACEEFLAKQPAWVRDYLLGRPTLETLTRVVEDPDGSDVLHGAKTEYEKLLLGNPEKLREYRKRLAKEGAKSALYGVPSAPVGAPRGIRRGTLVEAEQLLKLIDEFRKKHGTNRGAMDYATKKVYGSEGSQHSRIERGFKAVRRYKKHLENVGQKPST
jgi:hypothetical protein